VPLVERRVPEQQAVDARFERVARERHRDQALRRRLLRPERNGADAVPTYRQEVGLFSEISTGTPAACCAAAWFTSSHGAGKLAAAALLGADEGALD